MFSRWANTLNPIFRRLPAPRRARRQTTSQRARPAIDVLEDRCLLSSYTLTDLGTLGGPTSSAAAINSAGEVVGYADTNNYFVQTITQDSGKIIKRKVYQEEPFLWAPSAPNGTKGSLIDIGNQQGWYNAANGINDRGQVAGKVYLNNGATPRAFLWNPSPANGTTGTLIDLGSLGGPNSEATAINSAGQVGGDANTSSGGNDAFLWTPTTPNGTTGSMIALGTISNVTGINDSGEIVGSSSFVPVGVTAGNPPSAAFLSSGGKVINLGSLGGSSFQDASYAYAINSYGQVVGTSDVNTSDHHAFLWTPTTPHGTTGTLIDLRTLGGPDSDAYAINSAGQVVGESWTSGGGVTAFLWTPTTPNGTTGTMIDLNPLIGSGNVTLYLASGINDQGQIVGGGSRNGSSRAVLLTPTSTTVALAQPATLEQTTAARISAALPAVPIVRAAPVWLASAPHAPTGWAASRSNPPPPSTWDGLPIRPTSTASIPSVTAQPLPAAAAMPSPNQTQPMTVLDQVFAAWDTAWSWDR
jgi:probable HAF family extracellular repeat protein